MLPSEKSNRIAVAFQKYVKTGDKTLIEDIPKDDLEIAFLQYSMDKGFPHYIAMERKLVELKEQVGASDFKKNTRKLLCSNAWADISNEFEVTKTAFGRKIRFVRDPYKREIILRDTAHAYMLAMEGFSKPAVILSGSIIEELLRLYLNSKGIAPPQKNFDGYIKECESRKLLKSAISRLTDFVRHFRNFVHLEKETSPRHTISKATAKGAVASIFTIVNDFEVTA